MKAFNILTMIFMAFSLNAHAGEGLPLPWPFPWAKECPIEWQSLEGKYAMADSSKEEQVQISLHTVTRAGFRLVRVARLAKDGTLIAEGFNFVSLNQRTVRLYLFPLDRNEPTQTAVIKYYFASSSLSCGKENLVPILAVEKRGSTSTGITNYRLVKEDQKGKQQEEGGEIEEY
jgi:hypothetical protein